MGKEHSNLLLSHCVYIQIKYNKMCKAILEGQVTHERADCLPLHILSNEAEDLRNFTRKVRRP